MWYSYKIDDPSDDAFSLQFHSCCSIMSSKNVIFFSHTAETIVNVLDFKKDVGLWHGILTVSKPSSCKCVQLLQSPMSHCKHCAKSHIVHSDSLLQQYNKDNWTQKNWFESWTHILR